MKKRIAAVLIISAMFIASCFTASFASSREIKMTTYSQVYKSGNTVYCAGEGNSIYKVKVKKGKVISKKKLVKGDFCMGSYSYNGSLKKKGKYLYYIQWSEGTYSELHRVKVSGGKSKNIATNCTDYAIKRNKLYAEIYRFTDDDEYAVYRVMKLNGKNKKKTSVRPAGKEKKSNASSYSVKYKKKGKYVKTYLKTTKGTFYLGKSKAD